MRPFVVVAFFLLPVLAAAEDARTIFETMQERQIARWQGVQNYVLDQATMGHRVLLYHERVEVTGPDGRAYPAFRLVPPDEIARRQRAEEGFALSPEDLRRMSEAAEMTGDVMGSETERAMAEAGLPPGLLSASPNRFATLDPRVMMGNVAEFYDAAADAQAASDARDKTADARREASDMAQFAEMAEFVGTEPVYERTAWVVRASDIGRTERTEDGQELTIDTATFWIDTEEYVPLRLKMDGSITSGGETRAITIEKEDQDYRRIGGLYMTYRQVMRMAGIMDAKQRAEMQEAQAQLAEFEQQMAAMPEAQRQMAMNMMGPQIDMVRKMAAGGGIEVVTDVYQVRVNAGMPDEQAQAEVLFRAMPPTDGPQAAAGGGTPRTAGADSPFPGADGGSPSASGGGAAEAPAHSPTGGSGSAADAGAAQASPAAPAGTAGPPGSGAPDAAALRAAQQECLQKKVEEAQAAKKKRRGVGRLLGAASRIALRRGDREFARTVNDAYAADATVADLAAAAEDLGLTEDDVAACRHPL